MRPADTTREILHQLFGAQPRGFAVRLWYGTLWPEGAAEARVRVPLPHALALGESFIRGNFDVEGDLEAGAGAVFSETKRARRQLFSNPGGGPTSAPVASAASRQSSSLSDASRVFSSRLSLSVTRSPATYLWTRGYRGANDRGLGGTGSPSTARI